MSHSAPLSFLSHSPGRLGLSQTYPTVLCLTQSHCPSHPTVPGYSDYPGHIPLYWVSLSSTVLPIPQSRDTKIIPDICHCIRSLPIPQSRDTRIIPDISHCIQSHSDPTVFPIPQSQDTGIILTVLCLIQSDCSSHLTVAGLFRTYPTAFILTQSPLSFPSHSPRILGLYPLYWVSLSPTVLPIPSQYTGLKYITLLQIKDSFLFYFTTIMTVCYVENEENKSGTVHFSSHLDNQAKVCSNGRQVTLQSKICPPMTGGCEVE